LLGPFHRGSSPWRTRQAIANLLTEVAQVVISMTRGKFGIVNSFDSRFVALPIHEHWQKEENPKRFFHEEIFLVKVKNETQNESTFLPSENPFCYQV